MQFSKISKNRRSKLKNSIFFLKTCDFGVSWTLRAGQPRKSGPTQPGYMPKNPNPRVHTPSAPRAQGQNPKTLGHMTLTLNLGFYNFSKAQSLVA